MAGLFLAFVIVVALVNMTSAYAESMFNNNNLSKDELQ